MIKGQHICWPFYLPGHKGFQNLVIKNSDLAIGQIAIKVVPPGIEPGTHGFSVRCSTN